MSLDAWQLELRRQFGREQRFRFENAGEHPVFSEFRVTNPESKNTYRVAIRGREPGDNYCSCPDFATNALGTCKHVEFMLARLERRRGGRAALARRFRPTYSSVYLRYGARREVCFEPGQACPSALLKLAAGYFDRDGRLRPDAFGRFEVFLSRATRLSPDLRCYEDALAFVAAVRDGQRRAERLAAAFPQGVESAAFDKLVRVPLYEYQKEGALFASRAGRCLIGDEMGLGKTIQAVAAVEIMARHVGVERVLVICPTSLKHQWEREVTRLVDRPVEVVAGLRARRQRQFAADGFYKVMNYDTVAADLDLIRAWAPEVVILDEAQRIKNWSTRAARAVKKIASPYAIVLTGTPLENRLEELVSIVQFIDQHRLGPTFRFLHDHQVLDGDSGRVVGYQNLDRIGETLAPILIRRRKSEVLRELPARLEKRFFVPLTPEQRRHHDENRDIAARLVAKWRRHRFLSEADQRRLMMALQNMRMACDSTYLLDHETDHGAKSGEVMTLLGELLEAPDAKVVVFSQWVRMHELLVRRLEARRVGHVFFHGGVEGRRRKVLVDRFREDEQCRVFLSTDAGGVGLNLQHANVVINVDLPWNPAVLEQRIGRVHRLGQKRAVQVVNFIAQGTIEEGMLSLLGFKELLFAGVLDGGPAEVFLGGSRLSRFIESVEKVTGQIPAPAAEEAAGSEAAEDGSDASAAPDGADEPERQEPGDPWTRLLQSGHALLALVTDSLQEALASNQVNSATANGREGRGVLTAIRDPKTGEPYLQIRLPPPEVLTRAMDGIRAFMEGLAR